MRLVLILWGLPIVVFWGWYFASLHNYHFGYFFLTRDFHDHLFTIYGKMLFMDPADVPAAIAWLFFIDTLIVVGLALVGKYRRFWWPPLKNFVVSLFGFQKSEPREPIITTVGPTHPAE